MELFSIRKIKLNTIIKNNYDIIYDDTRDRDIRVYQQDNLFFKLVRDIRNDDNDQTCNEIIFKKLEINKIKLQLNSCENENEKKNIGKTLKKEKKTLRELQSMDDIVYVVISGWDNKIEKKINDLIKKASEEKNTETKKKKSKKLADFVQGDKKEYELDKLITDGFTYNRKQFKVVGNSASMGRNLILAFINTEILEIVDTRRFMDVDLTKDICISKFESYVNLLFSSCDIVEEKGKLPYIVIVPDLKRVIPNQLVITGKQVEVYSEKHKKTFKDIELTEETKDVEINNSDGCGIHCGAIGMKWLNNLPIKDKSLRPIGYTIRGAFLKGESVEVDFHTYFKENNVKYIKDYWGNLHPIDKVECVWSISMFKGKEYFDSWEQYKEKFEKYGHYLAINKYIKPVQKEKAMGRYNFQYTQVLNLDSEKIDKLLEYSFNYYKKIINGDDLLYKLNFLGVNIDAEELLDEVEENESEINIWGDIDSNLVKACIWNNKMFEDEYIQEYMYSMVKNYLKELKLGRFWLEGSRYYIITGDLYAFMQHVHKYSTGENFEITGCLKTGEFYCKGLEGKYVGSRSPMVSPCEQNKMMFIENEITEKYFRHLDNIIQFNSWDISCQKMAGADFDSDAIFCTLNSVIYDSIIDMPVVYLEGEKGEFKQRTTENLIKYYKSLTNRIGLITNYATYYLNLNINNKKDNKNIDSKNLLIKTLKNILILKKNKDNVSKLRLLQECEINSVKSGIKWDIPLYMHSDIKIKGTGDTRKPYFLIHRYRDTKLKYERINSEYNRLSKNKFMVEIKKDGDKTKKYKVPLYELYKYKDQLEEEEVNKFFKEYYNKLPVVISNSHMNLLCRKVEEWEAKNFIHNNKHEDTAYLMMDEKYYTIDNNNNIIINEKTEEFEKLLFHYYQFNKTYNHYKTQSLNKKEWENFYKTSREAIEEIYPNPQELATYCVYISYKKVKSGNKKFCWKLAEEGIIENIKKHKQEDILIPIETSSPEDTEYLGKYYSLIDFKLYKDINKAINTLGEAI